MEVAERAKALDWYHTLELAPGVETQGMFDLRPFVDRYRLPERLDGKRVLDVGTWDGFWAFEMERRGAAEVVALDIEDRRQVDYPPRRRPTQPSQAPLGAGFELAREALGSSVERVGCSIYEATPERLGTYDFVFCGSVLIHLRDQFLALERIAGLASDAFVSVEPYDPWSSRLPFPVSRYRADRDAAIVFWEPAARTWGAMLRSVGFDRVEEVGRFKLRAREGWKVRHVVHQAFRR